MTWDLIDLKKRQDGYGKIFIINKIFKRLLARLLKSYDRFAILITKIHFHFRGKQS